MWKAYWWMYLNSFVGSFFRRGGVFGTSVIPSPFFVSSDFPPEFLVMFPHWNLFEGSYPACQLQTKFHSIGTNFVPDCSMFWLVSMLSMSIRQSQIDLCKGPSRYISMEYMHLYELERMP